MLNQRKSKFAIYFFIICLLFISSIVKSDIIKKNSKSEKKDDVKINLGAVLGGSKIIATITNKTNNKIRTSNLGCFGNYVYLKLPSGEIIVNIICEKLPKNYIYKPDYIILPGKTLTIKDINKESLSLISENISKPGRYELWFEIIDWTNFKKNISKKYTSNKMIFFIEKKKTKSTTKQKATKVQGKK